MFYDSSQMIGSKGNMFSEFDEGHPGVVLASLNLADISSCIPKLAMRGVMVWIMYTSLHSQPPAVTAT